jgi:SsrA-binding protein
VVRLRSKLVERGFTLVPLAMYFKRGWVKLELGLAKGKKKEDKREYLKEKEARKEIKKYWR